MLRNLVTFILLKRSGRPWKHSGFYEGHCLIRYGTPGVPPNATDQPCDWIGCGGVDACHPDNVGYGEIAKAVKAAMVRRRLMAGIVKILKIDRCS